MRRLAIALALVVGVVSLTGCTAAAPRPAEVCHVDDKDRSTGPKGGSVYRVYTSCGVFEVDDNIFLGQFNAADTYARIQPGKTYRLTTYGWRNGALSLFPNITQAQEVK